MKLEIVTHCWLYSRCLAYQLSSLLLNRPKNAEVTITVFCALEGDPDTRATIVWFTEQERFERNWLAGQNQVEIRCWSLPQEQLFRRAIGRNMAALATEADWVWFADCDYVFGPGCLDTLHAKLLHVEDPLAFPRYTLKHRTHDLGDQAIAAASKSSVLRLPDDPALFCAERNTRAIGGIQIARGSVLRKIGYCKGTRHLRPTNRWRRTYDDRAFRQILGTAGKPIELPNLYRIRHSKCGRFEPGTKN